MGACSLGPDRRDQPHPPDLGMAAGAHGRKAAGAAPLPGLRRVGSAGGRRRFAGSVSAAGTGAAHSGGAFLGVLAPAADPVSGPLGIQAALRWLITLGVVVLAAGAFPF